VIAAIEVGGRLCDDAVMLALVLATAFALPPTDAPTRLDLRLDASVTTGSGPYYATPTAGQLTAPTRTTSSTVGAATAGVSYYPTAVSDDDAPAPLQPFLQRASILHLEGGGGGGEGTIGRSDGLDVAHATLASGHADVSAAAYFMPHIHLMASVGVHDDVSSYAGGKKLTTLTIPIAAGFGVRFYDVMLSAGWSFAPTQVNSGPLDVVYWGGLFFDAYAVVLKHIELDVNAKILDHGVMVGGHVTWWLDRRLGIGLGAGGGRSDAQSTHDEPATSSQFASGVLSLECWMSRRFGAALRYEPGWTKTTSGLALSGESVVTHMITLSFLARPH
jgi:hypothetical protein